MNLIFEKYKKELAQVKEYSPDEHGHMQADEILCNIAISASKNELNQVETETLVGMYNEIEKWFA